MDDMVSLAVRRGLDALLRDLMGSSGEELALKMVDQLAQENPNFVYRFVADRMRAGDVDFVNFVDSWKSFVDSSDE
jgi:hypothetical protein